MASLRRMASLECIRNVSSSPANPSNTQLIRHSSLPNLFLCQPELTMGALRRQSSLNKGFFHISESPSFHASAKVGLCRALSGSHNFDYDEMPEFDILAGARFFQPGRRECIPYPKEAINVAEASLDVEKSVVYSELRESLCRWDVPPRFFKPYDMGEKVYAERGTPTHTLEKPVSKPIVENKSQNISDLCMLKCSENDVKARPMSLRMLKRKKSNIPSQPASPASAKCKPACGKPLVEERFAFGSASHKPMQMGVGDSVSSAFASLVYMLKMLQHHALSPSMQTQDAAGENCQANWVGRAYAEMLDSFLWLFQQVFSCTPKLMLLTMMLLADFTLHSVSKHVVLPVVPLGEPPTATILPYNMGKPTIKGGFGAMSNPYGEQHFVVTRKHECKEEIFPSEHGGGGGGGGGGDIVRVVKHGGSLSDNNEIFFPLRKVTLESRDAAVDGDDIGVGISLSSTLLSSSTSSSSLVSHHVQEIKETDLDVATKNMLVAPVRAPTLEADDYPCFDLTDLTYQQEISMDPSNPLLLANYAQFLHVVRHDNGRAEKLYRRAVMAEADVDGEVMGRFASFLWVVKGDVVEADSAYKAAVAADPTNVYHAGCYAHFLWSSSACQAEETSCCVMT